MEQIGEIFSLFFGRIEDTTISFWNLLAFSLLQIHK